MSGERNRAAFDKAAWAYDAFLRMFSIYRDDDFVSALDLDSDDRVIDFGGGTGHYATVLAPLCRLVTVLDLSEQMLRRVPHRANIKTIKADMLDSGIDNESYDAALITDVLHHTTKQQRLIGEAHRILKAGGKLLILDMSASYSRTRILGLFERQWFGEVKYLTPMQALGMLEAQGFAAEVLRDEWTYLIRAVKN